MTAWRGAVHLVTGGRGAGKTTLCGALLDEALALPGGPSAAGVICPKVFEDGRETAIDVVDVATGRRRRLADRRSPFDDPAGPSTTRWRFSPEALRWGDDLLRSATPCGLLVVDELGILEFDRNEGWTGGIDAIDTGEFDAAVVVVRPELVDRARRRWPGARLISVPDPAGARSAARRLARQAFPEARRS